MRPRRAPVWFDSSRRGDYSLVTASLHRGEAFAAASFLMDYLKTEAPYWKKRHLAGKGAGDWVEAQPQDHAAAQRWQA